MKRRAMSIVAASLMGATILAGCGHVLDGQVNSETSNSEQVEIAGVEPDICIDTYEPPPCASESVALLWGFFEVTTGEFNVYPGTVTTRERWASGYGGQAWEDEDDLEVRAWDAQGREVAGLELHTEASEWVGDGVNPDGTYYTEFGTSVHITIAMPATSGVARVELQLDGSVLHEWNAGAQAPDISMVELVDLGSEFLVRWDVTDADGDDVTTTVFLLDADGARNVVRMDTTESSATVNPQNHVGPGPHRALIMVTDGINASWAVSEAVETTNQPPTVHLDDPDTTEYMTTLRNAFVIAAYAYDPEGEDLWEAVVWTSSIDGELSTGQELYINGDHVIDGPPISVGTHTITATVTDSKGASDSVSFTLVIEP